MCEVLLKHPQGFCIGCKGYPACFELAKLVFLFFRFGKRMCKTITVFANLSFLYLKGLVGRLYTKKRFN